MIEVALNYCANPKVIERNKKWRHSFNCYRLPVTAGNEGKGWCNTSALYRQTSIADSEGSKITLSVLKQADKELLQNVCNTYKSLSIEKFSSGFDQYSPVHQLFYWKAFSKVFLPFYMAILCGKIMNMSGVPCVANRFNDAFSYASIRVNI